MATQHSNCGPSWPARRHSARAGAPGRGPTPRPAVPPTPELVEIAEASAHRAWARQQAVVVAPQVPFSDDLSDEEGRRILDFLREIGVESLLFTPLGAGPECLGNLVLTRATSRRSCARATARPSGSAHRAVRRSA